MSHYYDTSSRAVDQPHSIFAASEDPHYPTEPSESHGFYILAYLLMYSAGLILIAAIVAWIFTVGFTITSIAVSLGWGTLTPTGEPPATIGQLGTAFASAILLSAIGALLTRATWNVVQHGSILRRRVKLS